MLADSILHSLVQMPQFVILMGMAVPIIGIIAGSWYKIHKLRSDAELKKSMIERGMSVEEIERVLAAKSTDAHRDRHSH